jgi:hypothetical protein
MVICFLPYPDFKECAKILNTKHLCKQRLEAYQIINAIEAELKMKKECEMKNSKEKKRIGWINHPACTMWKENLEALKYYCNVMIDEVVRRGYKNSIEKYDVKNITYPWYIGYKPFHYSHQASLLRKNPKDYIKYFKNLPEAYRESGYVWPSKLSDKQVKNIKKYMKGEIKKTYDISEICYPTITPVKRIEWYQLERVINGVRYISHIVNSPIEIVFIDK